MSRMEKVTAFLLIILALILYVSGCSVLPTVEFVPVHDGYCECDGLNPACQLPVRTYDVVVNGDVIFWEVTP